VVTEGQVIEANIPALISQGDFGTTVLEEILGYSLKGDNANREDLKSEFPFTPNSIHRRLDEIMYPERRYQAIKTLDGKVRHSPLPRVHSTLIR
ncbi:MAG: hypothetical protein WC521_09260, partial [Bdellovibrionales bacterium]